MVNPPCIVLTTCSNQEQAERIARHLLQHRVAACVNLIPGVVSWYWWEGSMTADSELMLVIKTVEDRIDELQRELLKIHSYQVPELVILPISGGNQPYLEWVRAETRRGDEGREQRG